MEERLRWNLWGWIRLGILIAVFFWLWWYFRGYELFVMLVLIPFFGLISVGSLLAVREKFRAKVILPAHEIGKGHGVLICIKAFLDGRILGFSAEITYRIRNVFTEYEETGKERIWISPGETVVWEKEMKSRHMGRIDAEILTFTVWDWMRLFKLEQCSKQDAWVIAGPENRMIPEEEPAICIEDFPEADENKKRGIDINPDYEIREYIPGDDLKSIHWKLTAKQGKTMVRERLASGRERMNVLLVLTENEETNDELMEALWGLGHLLIGKGYPVRLCWLGKGGVLQARFLAEEGELENTFDEILSVSGMQGAWDARKAIETEYPGEAYILVQNGAYKGAYIRR